MHARAGAPATSHRPSRPSMHRLCRACLRGRSVNTCLQISRRRSKRSPNNRACMVGSGMAKAYALMRPTRFYRTVVCIHTHTTTGPSHTASVCIAFAPHRVHTHPVLLIIAITLPHRASHLHPSVCAHTSVVGYSTTGTVRAQRPAGEEDWAEHIRPEPERRLVQQVCPNGQI